jgi:chemotaxis protein methyltransferase CheR
MPADAPTHVPWPRLSALIAEKTGLHFPPERHIDLQRGLSEAAAGCGFPSSAHYADWLLSTPLTPPDVHRLANHLTIGETYFLREPKTFDALAEHILPELIERRRREGKRLRLWSAACSTGEETYSLAMLVQRLIPDWREWKLFILGTDINAHSLAKAATGTYGEWSFRDPSSSLKERYFKRVGEGRYEILPDIRHSVTFAQLNLAQDHFPSLATDTNAMDLILCRNVLMYFTPWQARRLVGKLRQCLVDDAWLAVSPSECSQEMFAELTTVNFPDAILYQKRRRAQERIPASHLAGETPRAVPTSEAIGASALRAIDSAVTIDEILNAPAATEPGEDEIIGPPEYSWHARTLANQGQLAESLEWSGRWIATDRLNAAAHYLHAVVSQELGDRAAARTSLRRAIYLQPDLVLAHFALGNLARAESRAAEARRHFQNALGLLRRRPVDELVPESEGLTAGRLTEIISALPGVVSDASAR